MEQLGLLEEAPDLPVLDSADSREGSISSTRTNLRADYSGLCSKARVLLITVLTATCLYWGVSSQQSLREDAFLTSESTIGLSGQPVASKDGLSWGCGLVGKLPGIHKYGSQIEVTPEMQQFIDKVKLSSDYNKITYWAWALQPSEQPLSGDFLFMPDNWGWKGVDPNGVPQAHTMAKGVEIADILLGMNEPDIQGSCMDHEMFGKCTGPCDPDEESYCPGRPAPWEPYPKKKKVIEAWEQGICSRYEETQKRRRQYGIAEADLAQTPFNFSAVKIDLAPATDRGHCKCTAATGAGFESIKGCQDHQPLPTLFQAPHDMQCIDTVMGAWKQMAGVAADKGYRHLSTPLISMDLSYARAFIDTVCDCDQNHNCACTDISCGCPTHVAFHWYAFDCRPTATRSYEDLSDKLNEVKDLMSDFPFIQGTIINEVGILNCAPTGKKTSSQENLKKPNIRPPPNYHATSPRPKAKQEAPHPEKGCLPNTGLYPAKCLDGKCPANQELPLGVPSFIDQLFELMINAKTTDGRSVVKGFSWFNFDGNGGTYNLELFHKNGSVNEAGEAYMRNCEKWGLSRVSGS